MREETKNQLLSHIPIFLLLVIVVIIIILPDQFYVYGGVAISIDFIIQGLIYLFKKKIYFRFGYVSKIEKIIFGIGYIIVGIRGFLYVLDAIKTY